jgi:hypothetical protein
MNEAAAAPTAAEVAESEPVAPKDGDRRSALAHADGGARSAAERSRVARRRGSSAGARRGRRGRCSGAPRTTRSARCRAARNVVSALTFQYYGSGNSKLLARIRDLNPQIVNVDQIIAGDRLKLPTLDEADRPR